jgi:hypothetical protein
MEKTYEAARDFTDASGKEHSKGEQVSGLSQSEVQKLIADGSIRESQGQGQSQAAR